MIQPRNNYVVLRLIDKVSQKQGSIIIPATRECFCEAEVIAVGPGNVAAEGGRPDTADLQPGQVVFVNHKHPAPGNQLVMSGIPYRQGDFTYFLFNQSQIIGIVGTSEGGNTFVEISDGPRLAVPAKKTIIH